MVSSCLVLLNFYNKKEVNNPQIKKLYNIIYDHGPKAGASDTNIKL